MIVQKIESAYKHEKISCCNEQCNIRVKSKNNFVMLKGELLVQKQPERMCDCLIFQDNKKIGIVELKSKSLDVGKIIDKFTNSGKKSLSIVASFEPKSKPTLFFILLAKKYSNYLAHDRLRRSKIKIHGKTYPIRLGKCGCSLKDFMG